jgi:hypothetical protein
VIIRQRHALARHAMTRHDTRSRHAAALRSRSRNCVRGPKLVMVSLRELKGLAQYCSLLRFFCSKKHDAVPAFSAVVVRLCLATTIAPLPLPASARERGEGRGEGAYP